MFHIPEFLRSLPLNWSLYLPLYRYFTTPVPMTAISIAFCLDSIPVIGVVFAPFLGLQGTLYSAVLGVGAWMAETEYDAHGYPPPAQPLSSSSDDDDADDDEEGTYLPVELPIISPPPPLPSNAPNGCLYLSEWGKDRRPGDNMNLAKKRESFYNMAVGSSCKCLFHFSPKWVSYSMKKMIGRCVCLYM